MNAWTSATTAEDLCKAVREDPTLKKTLGDLPVRPFNHMQPAETPWWLLPEPANPAYHLGKFLFERTGSTLFVGLDIEKGLSAEATSMYTGSKAQNMTMDKSWVWHAAVADLGSGRLTRACDLMHERAGRSPLVRVEGGPYAPGLGNRVQPDKMHYRYVASDTLELEYDATPNRALRELKSVKTVGELAKQVAAQNDQPFSWVVLRIGFELDVDANGRDANSEWTARDVYTNIVDPLVAWFVGTRRV